MATQPTIRERALAMQSAMARGTVARKLQDKFADSLDAAVEAASDLMMRMQQVHHNAPDEHLQQAAKVRAMVAQVVVRLGELRDAAGEQG